MAKAKAKKKAKSKSKVKRKKIAKKPARKVAKKLAVRKPAAKAASKRVSAPPPPPPPGERIGVVTHYYGHLAVAVVKLDPGTSLRVGDSIHVKGHTSDFSQRVESLQIGHAPVQEVGPGDDFGLKVVNHAREHDVVYRVKPG
jgi:putative protease